MVDENDTFGGERSLIRYTRNRTFVLMKRSTMIKQVLLSLVFLSGFGTFAQIDSIFILKGNTYFSNEDFGYPDSTLHGRLCWYSNELDVIREPVLFNLSTEKTIYRFTFVSGWGGAYAIRLEKNDSSYTLYRATYIETIEKRVSRSQVKKIEKKLKRCQFWEMPARSERRGFDGSLWIFEGIKDSEYHVVDRWSPKKRSSYRKLCEYLMSLAF